MGYYTKYELETIPYSNEAWEVINEDDGTYYAVQEYADSCKWYDHEMDMKELSKQFPNVVFKLKGEGEEAGDLWHKYFKNGKVQVCEAKIVYDKFDESKLK